MQNNTLHKRNKTLAVIFAALSILWAALIFMLSAENGDDSADLSGGVVRAVIDTLSLEKEPTWLEHFIRKLAHFSEYFILGTFVLLAFVFGLSAKQKNGAKGIFASVPICMFYASTDEFHQGFVSGRSPQVTDVCIDTLGALLAGGVIIMCILLFGRKNTVPQCDQ